MRQVLAPVVLLSALVTSVVVPVPAQAATLSVNCGSSSTTAVSGATVTVNFSGCDRFNWIYTQAGTATFSIVFNPGSITAGVPLPGQPAKLLSTFAPSATSFTASISGPARGGRLVLGDGVNTQTINFAADPDSNGGSSSDSAASVGPVPIIQQFGKPASGTCNGAAPASLNWSGVASDGWGESWAQWIDDGTGGLVCTRTLVYRTAAMKWVVG